MRYSHLLFLFGLASLGFFNACKQDNDPETIVRMWQRHLDENKFEEAKKLSTDRAKQWLDIIAKMVSSDEQGVDTFRTVFKQMVCTVIKDSAICRYSVMDEGTEVVDSMFLKKINGKWLVDIKLDEIPDESEVQDFYDDMYEEAPDTASIQ